MKGVTRLVVVTAFWLTAMFMTIYATAMFWMEVSSWDQALAMTALTVIVVIPGLSHPMFKVWGQILKPQGVSR